MRRAREDFKNGEYRFVAEVANKLVFADASNKEARDLAAERVRTARLSGESARGGMHILCRLNCATARKVGRGQALNPETVRSIPTETLFDFLGCSLTGQSRCSRW